ncbi:MAG: hypothetical protein AAF806_13260 [Bacteroidota bacterium]
MQQNFFYYTLCFLLLLTRSSSASVVHIVSEDRLSSYENQYNDLRESTTQHYTADVFQQIKGRKPKFSERIVLKVLQRNYKKAYKKLGKRIEKYKSINCDLMILKNGDEIEAKVTEINSSEVKFRRCDNLDGPVYTKKKSEVFMIKYSNGTKEMISSTADPVTEPATTNQSYNNYNSSNRNIPDPYADNENTAGGWVVGILGGLLLGLLGLLLAFVFEKGAKRRAFFSGWAIGFGILILLILAAAGA